MAELVTRECTCGGPAANTNVDGNEGHNPGCAANPKNHPEDHPPYLDDDGMEGVQFVRYDLAAGEIEAEAYLKNQDLWWTDDGSWDVVWMAPDPTKRVGGEDWYDVVPAHVGIVRYWRFQP